MANIFSDLLKGSAKYLTTPGRDLAQMLKLTMMGSKVKEVRPEDFSSLDKYNRALQESNLAYQALQEEMESPTANWRLNELLGVTEREKERQKAENLLTPATAIKNAMIGGSMTFPSASTLLGSIGAGATSSAMGAAGYVPHGEEKEAVLPAALLGGTLAGVGYGLGQWAQSLTGKIKSAKAASDQATKNLGLDKKAIEKLGGWEGAKRFAGEFYDDAAQAGLNTTNRYSRAEALQSLGETLSTQVDDALATSTGRINLNDILAKLDSDDLLRVNSADSNKKYMALIEKLIGSADMEGNIGASSLKEALDLSREAAGGFARAVGDQAAKDNQILSRFGEIVRDSIGDAFPEISGILSKWSRYIKATPSITAGQVGKTASITTPIAKVGGSTLATKISDWLSNLLSSQGSPEKVVDQSGLSSLLSGAGGLLQKSAPILGTLGTQERPVDRTGVDTGMGGMDMLGEDDEGLRMIRSAFQTEPGEVPGGQAEEIKQLLAMGILSGEISSTDATAVLELLGFGGGESRGKTLPAGNIKALAETQEALNLLPALSGLLDESSSAFGPIEGQIRSRIPWDKTGQKAKSTITLVRQIIGKGLEGGVLRKEDEYKYEQILPKLGDTEDTVRTKIKLLEETLLNKYRTSIEAYQVGGYDPYSGSGNSSALYEMLGL